MCPAEGFHVVGMKASRPRRVTFWFSVLWVIPSIAHRSIYDVRDCDKVTGDGGIFETIASMK